VSREWGAARARRREEEERKGEGKRQFRTAASEREREREDARVRDEGADDEHDDAEQGEDGPNVHPEDDVLDDGVAASERGCTGQSRLKEGEIMMTRGTKRRKGGRTGRRRREREDAHVVEETRREDGLAERDTAHRQKDDRPGRVVKVGLQTRGRERQRLGREEETGGDDEERRQRRTLRRTPLP